MGVTGRLCDHLLHLHGGRPARKHGPSLSLPDRIAGLEDRALRDLTLDVERHLAVDARQRPQMCREDDADHGSVWTSTDTTAGSFRRASSSYACST
jgi:hypothetical protein